MMRLSGKRPTVDNFWLVHGVQELIAQSEPPHELTRMPWCYSVVCWESNDLGSLDRKESMETGLGLLKLMKYGASLSLLSPSLNMSSRFQSLRPQ
jgi:hypothetical protein